MHSDPFAGHDIDYRVGPAGGGAALELGGVPAPQLVGAPLAPVRPGRFGPGSGPRPPPSPKSRGSGRPRGLCRRGSRRPGARSTATPGTGRSPKRRRPTPAPARRRPVQTRRPWRPRRRARGPGRSSPTRFSPQHRQLHRLLDHSRLEPLHLARKAATSDTSAGDLRARPGRDDCKAAIALSRATARNREITDRSTPASAAASAWEICPESTLTHKSCFCSAERTPFGFLGTELTADSLQSQGQHPPPPPPPPHPHLLHHPKVTTPGWAGVWSCSVIRRAVSARRPVGRSVAGVQEAG